MVAINKGREHWNLSMDEKRTYAEVMPFKPAVTSPA